MHEVALGGDDNDDDVEEGVEGAIGDTISLEAVAPPDGFSVGIAVEVEEFFGFSSNLMSLLLSCVLCPDNLASTTAAPDLFVGEEVL